MPTPVVIVIRLILSLLCAVAIAACTDEIAELPAVSQEQKAARLAPQSYAPLVDVGSPIRGSVHYASWLGHGIVESSVVLLAPEPNARYGALRFGVACVQEGIQIDLLGLSRVGAGEVEVELSIDGTNSQTQIWQEAGVLGLQLVGEQAQALYADLRPAQQLSITIPAYKIGPLDLAISEIFETPLQESLDYCGDYHPTERRVVEPTHVPIVGVNGSATPYLTFQAVESEFGSRSVLTTSIRLAPIEAPESARDLRFLLLCNGAGQFRIRLVGLSGKYVSAESIQVLETLDNSVATTSRWWITSDGDDVVADTTELG